MAVGVSLPAFTVFAADNATTSVFFASQSGRPTLDQGEGGGNPFASSLIEILDRPSFTYSELAQDIISLTRVKSRGFQTPEVRSIKESMTTAWSLKPTEPMEKRLALVFVYSDYEKAGVASLPGADHDLVRVSEAFERAGFSVATAANPTARELEQLLSDFSERSQDAETAAIYMTGHGFEHNGKVYLAPNNYPFRQGPDRLTELGISVERLPELLNARNTNVVFYGGCRNELR
jgi:hypothetical protein